MITLQHLTRLEFHGGSLQALRLEKTYSIAHPRSVVWQSILDPDLLAEILPGCKSLTPLAEDRYLADIEIKIGPISGSYSSELEITDKIPPVSYNFSVLGNGVKGHMSGKGKIELQGDNGSTLLAFSAEGNVGGILARIGQRLVLAAGKKLMDQGFRNFSERLGDVQYA